MTNWARKAMHPWTTDRSAQTNNKYNPSNAKSTHRTSNVWIKVNGLGFEFSTAHPGSVTLPPSVLRPCEGGAFCDGISAKRVALIFRVDDSAEALEGGVWGSAERTNVSSKLGISSVLLAAATCTRPLPSPGRLAFALLFV